MGQSKYNCYEQDLMIGDQKMGKIAILFGGLDSQNPKDYMDSAVSDYLKKIDNPSFNQFVEIHMDNPWLRIIVIGIDNLEYHEMTIDN